MGATALRGSAQDADDRMGRRHCAWRGVGVGDALAALWEAAVRRPVRVRDPFATDGYMVSPTIARLWGRQGPELRDVPGIAEHFLPRGRAPEAGEKFIAPAHARTLARIAETKGEARSEERRVGKECRSRWS